MLLECSPIKKGSLRPVHSLFHTRPARCDSLHRACEMASASSDAAARVIRTARGVFQDAEQARDVRVLEQEAADRLEGQLVGLNLPPVSPQAPQQSYMAAWGTYHPQAAPPAPLQQAWPAAQLSHIHLVAVPETNILC